MTAHPWDTGLTIILDDSVQEYFAPDIEAYCSILLNRLMPVFNDVKSVYQEAATTYRARFPGIDDSSEDFDEQVDDHASNIALQFDEMRDVFIAVGVSGLFHLFEKQVYRHLNRDFARHGAKPIGQWDYAKRVIQLFTQRYEDQELALCMDLVSALQHPDLQELEALANSVKHGADGRSYQALIDSGSPVVAEVRSGNDISPQTILKVDLTITDKDVDRYKNAILAFWAVEGEFWAPYVSLEEAKKPKKAV